MLERLEDRRVFDANQAPFNWVPGTQEVDENSALTFASWQGNQVSISDPDADGNAVQVSLTVSNGTLTLNGYSGLNFSSGWYSGYSYLQFDGKIGDINAALDGLTYTPNSWYTGADNLQITTDDWGNSGEGGPLSDTDDVGINVNSTSVYYNQAPSNYVPGAQTVVQNNTLTFASWQGNQLSIGDPDAGDNAVQVSLDVSSGTLTLNGDSGLSFSSGWAYGYSNLQFYGSISDINTALEGMTYTPYSWHTGSDTLRIYTSDLGNSGEGGELAANDEVQISVEEYTHTNEGPSNSVPDWQVTDQYTALTFASWQGNQISISDPDAGDNAVQVTLSVSYGTLTLNGYSGLNFIQGSYSGYSYVQFYGSISDINTALDGLTYTPYSWYIGDDSLQITTDDWGNSGDGGPLSATNDVGITVNPYTVYYNQAPSNSTPGSQSVDQYSALTFASWQGNQISISDPDAGGNAVQVSLSVSNGTLTLNGYSGLNFSSGWYSGYSYVQFNGSISDINTALDGLTYTPYSWYTGGDNLQITTDDWGNSGDGGSLSATSDVGITVNPYTVYYNQAPSNQVPSSQCVEQNSSLFFASWQGNLVSISDPDAGQYAVQVTLSVGNGTLTLNGDAGLSFSSGWAYGYSYVQFYGSISDINTALDGLAYTPHSWYTGADNLQITTDDLGYTGEGGPQSATSDVAIQVVISNHAPTGSDQSVTVAEDQAYVLSVAQFGFSDPQDSPTHNLQAVKINTLPSVGNLTWQGAAVTSGQFISASEIVAGQLRYTPAPHAFGNAYASFTFQVQDDGGTAYAGVDLDPSAKSLIFHVLAVNDAPQGANRTVTVSEGTAFTFNAGHFGLIDGNDSPANQLLAVKLTTLPVNGNLTNNGQAVASGQFIAASDIVAGRLRYMPAANGAGIAYASFTFQVQDDGGTLNGGVDLDPTAKLLTIDVPDDDTTGPEIVLSGSTGSESDTAIQSFAWSVSDVSGVSSVSVVVRRGSVAIYAATTSMASGTFNFDSFGTGLYTIDVTASDADGDRVGDASSSASSRSVTVISGGVSGGAGNDHIRIRPTNASQPAGEARAFNVAANGVETLLALFSTNLPIVVSGNGGNDTLEVVGTLTRGVRFYGGSGNDVLIGGNGHDILVGGDGNDVLTGRLGNDLLLGGTGVDRLLGGLATGNTATTGDENLLIGDATVYDGNDAALIAILGEWSSTNKTTAARISSLRAGVTYNGTSPGTAKLVAGTTILPDSAIDQLFGTAAFTWFWSIGNNEAVTRKRAADQLN